MLVFISEIGLKSEGLDASLNLGIKAMKEELEPEGTKEVSWKCLKARTISNFITGHIALSTHEFIPSGPGALLESMSCRALQISFSVNFSTSCLLSAIDR